MKIIIDNKIPYIKEAVQSIADEAVYAPGKDFTPELVRDADALIIRTRTHCNRELLEGSRVKFIATATIGFDHIDTEYCKQAGIEWTNAPGCNSASVAQYVQASLLVWKAMKNKKLEGLTIGIIGVGNVGSKVAKVANDFGMRVLLNDLPREEKEGNRFFTSLNEIAEECDIITFHVPLYKEGKYRTFHLADTNFFRSLKRKPVIINTSRGEVIETGALLEALDNKSISDAIIDVREIPELLPYPPVSIHAHAYSNRYSIPVRGESDYNKYLQSLLPAQSPHRHCTHWYAVRWLFQSLWQQSFP